MCFLSRKFRNKHPDALKVSCLCGHQFSPLSTSRVILAVTVLLYIIFLFAFWDLCHYHSRPAIMEPIKWICFVFLPVAILMALIGVFGVIREHRMLVPQITVYGTLALFSTIVGTSFVFNALHLPFFEELWMVEELLEDKAIAVLLAIVFFLFAAFFKFCTIVLLKCYILLKKENGPFFHSI